MNPYVLYALYVFLAFRYFIVNLSDHWLQKTIFLAIEFTIYCLSGSLHHFDNFDKIIILWFNYSLICVIFSEKIIKAIKEYLLMNGVVLKFSFENSTKPNKTTFYLAIAILVVETLLFYNSGFFDKY